MWDGCNADPTKATKKSLKDYNLYLHNITKSKIRAKNPNVNSPHDEYTTHRMGQDTDDDFGLVADALGWSYPKSQTQSEKDSIEEKASESDKQSLERPLKYEKLEERQNAFAVKQKINQSQKNSRALVTKPTATVLPIIVMVLEFSWFT